VSRRCAKAASAMEMTNVVPLKQGFDKKERSDELLDPRNADSEDQDAK